MDRIKSIILKRTKASSMVETIVASVVIMVVFGICLTTIGNILENTVRNNTKVIDKELNKLEYFYEHDKIEAPDLIDFKDWQVQIIKEQQGEVNFILLKAKNKNNGEEKSKQFLE